MAGSRFHARDIFTVSNFLSPTECETEIAHAEHLGFADAPLNIAGDQIMVKDVRNNDRVVGDDPQRAAWLRDRLVNHVPSPFRIFRR